MIPAEKYAVVTTITLAVGNGVFAPDRKILASNLPARNRGGGDVCILGEIADDFVGRVQIAIHVECVGEPGANAAVIVEHGQILAAIVERGFEERGDVGFADFSLIVGVEQRFQIQKPAERLTGVGPPPN